MRHFRSILFFAIALSAPASAAERDCVASEIRHSGLAAGFTRWGDEQMLHARGPGALFATIEAAALDALTYAHLQAREANDLDRMRGGTIFLVAACYSYAEVHVANSLNPRTIRYALDTHAVARFHVYPRSNDILSKRAKERLSKVDRRTVRFVDPLHRTLYVLHPSLTVRQYSGVELRRIEIANLRHPVRTSRPARN